ncbi:MAG: O-antigen ligase family protein [Clostridiales bacterium]|nr:O-antigen ligase family protein [Clostridiales bacterium]
MINQSEKTRVINRVWLGLFLLYIMTSYFAQDVLLPSLVNSVMLYSFLAFSLVAIAINGKIKTSSLISWQIAFLLLSLLSLTYSPETEIFSGAYYDLIVNFILVFILSQMEWSAKRLNLVFRTFVFAASTLIILLYLTDNLEDPSGRLGEELMGNANILAMMLMVSAIYGMWLLASSNSKTEKTWLLLALGVIYIGMFLSGGRKFVVVPIVFLYIVLLNKTDKKGRKHIIKYTITVLAIAVAIYLLMMKVPFFYQTIGYRFKGFFALFDDSYGVDNSTLERTMMIEAGFARWFQSPLWGFGFDSFKYYNETSVTGFFFYSHNNFVELLYNQGVIGFIAYYSFYFYLIFSASQKKENVPHKGFIMGTMVALLLFEYFGVTYSLTPVQFLLFFCFYMLRQDDYSKRNTTI